MTSILNRIKSIIKSDIIICGSKNSEVFLEEEKNTNLKGAHYLKKIKLKDFQGSRILIKTDEGTRYKNAGKKNGKAFHCMSPLFSTDAVCKHNRVCDGVIIEEVGQSNLRIVLIELKSTDISGAETQLKNTKYFIDYLISLVRNFHGEKVGKIDCRYIIFHTQRGSMPKRTTRPPFSAKASGNIENPTKLVVKNGEEISINRIY